MFGSLAQSTAITSFYMHSNQKIFRKSFVPITVALFIVNAHITDDGIDPTEILASDKSIARTLAKISEDGNEGRLVVLVCRNKCTRQRAQVSRLTVKCVT